MAAKNTITKIATMYGASILAVVLGFLVSIFNSRILGPEQFGDYKFIQTVGTLIASLISVGFFISLTRLLAINKEKIKEAKFVGLFVIIFGIVSVIGMVLMLAFSLIEPIFFDHGLDSKFRIFFFIIPAILGVIALKEVLKGMHRIYALSILSFIPALLYLAIIFPLSKVMEVNLEQVLLVFYGIGTAIVAFYIIRLKPNFSFKKSIVKELMIENQQNGKPIYYGSIAGVATQHIAGISISYFMDNIQVGFFMLAMTICKPILMIPSVIGTVYFKQFATIKAIPKKAFIFSILSTLIALLVFYFLIEMVVVTFYSEEYLEVSGIAKILILGFIFHGLGDLFNRFLGAKGKGKLLRNAAYIVGIVNVLGYTILVKYFDLNGAILTKILASGLYMIVMCFYYLRFVKNNKNEVVS
ncbi:oligosaccharide flippase family protein [Maribacter sp. 2308TA10-17]|uniref:oligosaccharide flippase family protein n=1 Tax=Maribacter sp. 2308TA10-17 TaxID=3386276 RepID=UPI0039BC35A6